jgi:hypothetical protein
MTLCQPNSRDCIHHRQQSLYRHRPTDCTDANPLIHSPTVIGLETSLSALNHCFFSSCLLSNRSCSFRHPRAITLSVKPPLHCPSRELHSRHHRKWHPFHNSHTTVECHRCRRLLTVDSDCLCFFAFFGPVVHISLLLFWDVW